MKVKFGLTFVSVIILAVVTFMVVEFEAESGESILPQQYDLGRKRSLGLQYYQMDVEIITRGSDGSRAKVETYSMRLMGKPGNLSAGKADRWTCAWFALKIGEGPEVTVPAIEGWSYDFNRGVGIDEHGQVMGIPHAKFESLTDNKGKKLDALVGYQVYNQFVQFHAYVDHFATADLEGGNGIQDLKRIGDRIVLDNFSEDLPLAVGLIIKEGSIFKPGVETLKFKGLSVVDGKSCALLGVDGGEGSYTMIIEVMPDVNAKTVGGTHYFGDIYVDLVSMWLKKAEITVVDVTETSMGGKVVANTTLESHYRIRAMTE
ncbi:MAG: hypothetical protein HQ580_15420 [Planctomycetes bacterium]|nr:hypothetical protein [Planctomycetota bacterium]